jgi:predicted Zn-dependent peptidase
MHARHRWLSVIVLSALGCAPEAPLFPAKEPRPPRPAVLPGSSAPTETKLRATPPDVTPDALRLPAIRELTLPSGLRVVLVEQHGIPIVSLRVVVGYGLDDAPGLTTALFSTGTPSRPRAALLQEFREMGAIRDVSAHATTVALDVQVTSVNANAALVRMADVIQHAQCEREDLAEAKRLASGAIRGLASDALLRASTEMERLVDPAQPTLMALGDEVEKTECASAARAFHQLVTPARALLLIAGDFKTADMEAATRALLSTWLQPSSPILPSHAVAEPASTKIRIVDHAGDSQAVIAIGAYVPEDVDGPLHEALVTLSGLLGGGTAGRLGDATRWHLGVTYGASASVEQHRSHGVFAVRGAFETARAVQGLQQALAAIDSLGTTPFSADDIKRAQAHAMARSFVTSGATVSALSPFIHTKDREALGQFLDRSFTPRPLTPEDLQRVARRYLSRERLQLAIVGDATRLVPALAAAGLQAPEVTPY